MLAGLSDSEKKLLGQQTNNFHLSINGIEMNNIEMQMMNILDYKF